MVNWNDPSVFYSGYLAQIKLDHAIAGIYIWETVFTARFELDVLRGEQPYRWTIWLYLGTRYTALVTFILILIGENGVKVSCQPFTIAYGVSIYVSWAFASLTMVLRVIAIWNRRRIISFLSVSVWLAGVATTLHSLSMSPQVPVCCCRHSSGRHSAPHEHANRTLAVCTQEFNWYLVSPLPTGDALPFLFYRLLISFKCIIWIALASIAEVPVVVFLILNLNGASGIHTWKN
ncbi:hypothetical protein BJV78DRAFT_725090 [Lactifluus subvellereus]|nr:hypothetical protein BJV78DRAFT_725090 [Lactifluus subvellereus]